MARMSANDMQALKQYSAINRKYIKESRMHDIYDSLNVVKDGKHGKNQSFTAISDSNELRINTQMSQQSKLKNKVLSS